MDGPWTMRLGKMAACQAKRTFWGSQQMRKTAVTVPTIIVIRRFI